MKQIGEIKKTKIPRTFIVCEIDREVDSGGIYVAKMELVLEKLLQ